MGKIELTLYVTGQTSRTIRAISNLREICEDLLEADYDLSVVDVLEQPRLAEEAKILATPTLVKRLPPPTRRLVGDLSDRKRVMIGLGLDGLKRPVE